MFTPIFNESFWNFFGQLLLSELGVFEISTLKGNYLRQVETG